MLSLLFIVALGAAVAGLVKTVATEDERTAWHSLALFAVGLAGALAAMAIWYRDQG